LRRRVESVNRIVEARSEAEAINRVANQQRALGFMIKEAKIKEAIDPKRFMRPVENQLPAGLDKPKKKPEEAKKEPVKEEAIDEARPMSDPVFRSVATKALTKDMDPNFGYAANKLPAHIKAAQAKSDVLSKVVKRPQAGTLAALKKEEVEYIEEKLTSSDPASKWIHDFVHSDNPKFAGKSKKERINMALGAKYAADRAVKEEVEDIDEANKMSRVEWRMGTENEVDKNNKRIRKVANGIITTVCGNDSAGYSGDGGDASSATLNYPRGLCIDAYNNIYIADTANNVIRKINATTKIISTIAGNVNAVPTTDLGNGAVATSISVNLRIPQSVYVDSSQNIYIADTGNRRIRKVDATTQTISTYCGTGNGGFNGDNILATAANLNIPVYVTGDASYIYVTDLGHNRVRKINKSTNMITTVIGNGDFEYTGDNIPATSAGLNQPRGLGIDTLGNIYVADTLHSRVRKVYA